MCAKRCVARGAVAAATDSEVMSRKRPAHDPVDPDKPAPEADDADPIVTILRIIKQTLDVRARLTQDGRHISYCYGMLNWEQRSLVRLHEELQRRASSLSADRANVAQLQEQLSTLQSMMAFASRYVHDFATHCTRAHNIIETPFVLSQGPS